VLVINLVPQIFTTELQTAYPFLSHLKQQFQVHHSLVFHLVGQVLLEPHVARSFLFVVGTFENFLPESVTVEIVQQHLRLSFNMLLLHMVNKQ
jgi:hypothetical protein